MWCSQKDTCMCIHQMPAISVDVAEWKPLPGDPIKPDSNDPCVDYCWICFVEWMGGSITQFSIERDSIRLLWGFE